MKDVPGVPTSIEPTTKKALQALTDAVRTIIKGVNDGTIGLGGSGGGGSGGGVGGGPIIMPPAPPGPPGPPGEPGGEVEPDLTPPPTPSGFTAAAGLTIVIVEWDVPVYSMGHGHAQANLYGAKWPADQVDPPVFADAVQVLQVPGAAQVIANFATEPATRWCLWLTWQTNDGVESVTPAGGTNGLQVTTAQDPALLLEVLTGQIRREQLFTDLGETIDLIEAPFSVPGSPAARVKAETDARIAALTEEVGLRDAADDAVKTLIRTEFMAADTATYAAAQTYVQSYTFSTSGVNGAIAAAVSTMTAAYQAADAGVLVSAQSMFTTYAYARADVDSALVALEDELRAEIQNNEGGVSAAYVQNYTFSKAESTAAEAAQTSTLTSLFQLADQNQLTAINANLANNFYTRTQADLATVQLVTSLTASIVSEFAPLATWDFNLSADGWQVTRATLVLQPNGIVFIPNAAEPQIYRGVTPFAGATYDKVRMRMRKTSGTVSLGDWLGRLQFSVPGQHATTNSFYKDVAKPAALDSGAWCILEWDMQELTVGGSDWITHTVDGLLFGLMHNTGNGDPMIELDWIAIGRAGPPASQAQIADLQTAIATGDAAAASRIDTIAAAITVRPNLLKNGGFERGLENWSDATGWGVLDTGWGRFAYRNTASPGGSLDSTRVPVYAGSTYTVAGDTTLFAAAGTCCLVIIFTDGAGTVLGSGAPALQNTPHDFSDGPDQRKAHASQATAPSGAVFAFVRFQWFNCVNLSFLGVRQVKLEQGALPATAYTAEQTAVTMTAAIQTEATARAAGDAAVASLVTTVQSSIATRANLLTNGGFEQGLAGWVGASNNFFIADNAWGRVALSSAAPSSGSMQSAPFAVQPGSYYTVAGDSMLFATQGMCYFDIVFADINGNYVGETGENALFATHDFSEGGQNRTSHSVEGIAPAGATQGAARFVWFGVSGLITMGCRLIKAERGRLPATVYSSESGATSIAASVQTEQTTRATETGNLFTKYTVKVDVDGYVSGFGLAASNNNGTPTSSFIFRANSFAVASPEGPSMTPPIQPIVPFIVRTTPSMVNGVAVPPGVYMDAAYITNLTVLWGRFGTLIADTIKAADISATKLTVGDGTVGGNLKSANFASGVAGWILRPDGTAQFPSAYIMGQLTANQINANGLHVRGAVSGGAITAWPNWGPAGSTGFYLGPEGFMMGSLADNRYFVVASNGDVYSPNFTMLGGAATFTGQGSLRGGSFTGYAWPAPGQSGFYLGSQGLLLGNASDNRYFQVESNGNVYAPGFSIVNGSATFAGTLAANTVQTNSIVGAGVTRQFSAETSAGFVDCSFTIPSGVGSSFEVIFMGNVTVATGGGFFQYMDLSVNGGAFSTMRSESCVAGTVCSLVAKRTLAPGNYTVRMGSFGGSDRNATAVVNLSLR